jgi:hypothetical protein
VKQQTSRIVGDLLLLSDLILSMPFVNRFGDVEDRDADSIGGSKRYEGAKRARSHRNPTRPPVVYSIA